MPKRGSVLLRVANVNPDGVHTHSDRVLYRAIGVFIVLYFLYATAGGAAFLDASSGYAHPWWQWVAGPLVAAGVVAYDRAVVGRVSVSFAQLGSADPEHLLRRPTKALYLGRLALALLFAVIITEPLMLARYRTEIDARLATVHSHQLAAAESSGAIGAYQERLAELAARTAGEDRSVTALAGAAASKRRDARALYAQAVADSAGDGVTRRPGCPPGGSCAALLRRSRAADRQAAAVDRQAAQLQDDLGTPRVARSAETADLVSKIDSQRTIAAAAIDADTGFGARTKAMWQLVTGDFWGVGLFYTGIALLLVALDCAAVALKFLSYGNAYERAEARSTRQAEHAAALALEREMRAAEAYGAAAARLARAGMDAAVTDETLVAAARARAVGWLRTQIRVGPAGIADDGPLTNGLDVGEYVDELGFDDADVRAAARATVPGVEDLARAANSESGPQRSDLTDAALASANVAWAAGAADVAAAMTSEPDRPDSSDTQELRPEWDSVRA